MLVLSRAVEEEVVIDDTIFVKVLGYKKNGEVRLGFAAPRELQIHRREVYDAIQREKAKSSQEGDITQEVHAGP